MLKKVFQYIDQEKLLTPNSLVVVGCSGGPDSVCLLHLLQSLHYPLLALHCNFHLRGEESNRDQAFVEHICQDWGIPLRIQNFDTTAYAKEQKISIEMAARDLRYEWFEKIREEVNAQAIAVAHHKNDNIETCLLNLIRGTGIQGLTGMQPKNGWIVRPLLLCTRKEIEAYLQAHQLESVMDSTNLETEFTRNKIRHEVWPLLLSINPALEQIMGTNMMNFQAVNHIYQHYLSQQKKQFYRQKDNTVLINLSGLQDQLEAETLLYEWVKEFKIHPAEISKILHAETGKHFENATYQLSIERSENKKSRLLVIRQK